VALPFGTFDKVLSAPENKDVAAEVAALSAALREGQHDKLPELRKTVLKLQAPDALVDELRTVFNTAGLPWPGDEGEKRWEQAWLAIKKVSRSPTTSGSAWVGRR
jgi:alpha-glucan,water dikinase